MRKYFEVFKKVYELIGWNIIRIYLYINYCFYFTFEVVKKGNN